MDKCKNVSEVVKDAQIFSATGCFAGRKKFGRGQKVFATFLYQEREPIKSGDFNV